MASSAPTFADIVVGSSSAQAISISPKTVSRYKGIPLISFSDSEIDDLAAPFKYSLVGTFWYGKPPLKVIRDVFEKIGFHQDLRITLIDQSHILLNFTNVADYLRCFYRRSWLISGCHMRITKWTVDFDPSTDVPIVPVWIAFPGLPIHLHRKEALFEIVKPIGCPIKLDVATKDGLRPSVARVCVEVDVSKDLPPKIYLQAKGRFILQTIIYEDLPLFCTSCRRLGHAAGSCTPPSESAIPPPPSPPPRRPPAQRWTPVKKRPTTQQNLPDTTPPSSDTQAPPTSITPDAAPLRSLDPAAAPLADHHDELVEPMRDTQDSGELGYSSDNDLPETAPQEIPMVPAEVACHIQQLPLSPDTDTLISRLQDSTEGFIQVVPRRKRRAKKDLPPLPPSSILTRSASHAIQGSDSTLLQ